MNSQINIRDFLHEILANKAKIKLTMEEFDSILKMADQIQKFSQKGLLIVALTEQLHKISNMNYVSIKKFMNQFITGLKPQKLRKQREVGHVRRPRVHPVDTTNVARDLDQMAEYSVSNPSNPEMPRFGVDGLPSQQKDSNDLSQNGSKTSDPNKRDLDFAKQLNKISQVFQLNTAQQDYDRQPQQIIQEYSKTSSSSSQSFGVVSNLSEKMDLIRGNQDNGEKKTKTARRPSTVEATITKKKAKINIVDQMLTLQKTRATLDDTAYLEGRSISYEYEPWLDQYHDHNEMFNQTYQEYLRLLKEKPLSALNYMGLSAKKNGNRRDEFENIDTNLTHFDTEYPGQTMYDFTSQPMPVYSQDFQSQNFANSLSIFQQEEFTPTLSEISQRIKKPEAIVFYEMLAKMQKGEVIMMQQNPTDFGEIRVQLLRSSS